MIITNVSVAFVSRCEYMPLVWLQRQSLSKTDAYSGLATRVYDAENRLTSETQANNYLAGSYTYNGDGQRVRRKVNGTETWQVYGLGGELLAEYPMNGATSAPQKEYGYRNGQLLITADAPPTQTGQTQNVEWTNAVGVSVSGNGLTKTATTAWGNAGAASTQTLTSGDGYVEMTVGETGHARIFGFSHTDTNQNWDTVDFGLHCSNHTDNAIYIYESGTERGTFGAYAVGDKLRVSIVAGVVKYSKNGTVFYTSAVPPAYPLRVDTALYDTGATLMSGVISGNLTSSNIQWLVTDQLGTPRMVFDKSGSLPTRRRSCLSRNRQPPQLQRLLIIVFGSHCFPASNGFLWQQVPQLLIKTKRIGRTGSEEVEEEAVNPTYRREFQQSLAIDFYLLYGRSFFFA